MSNLTNRSSSSPQVAETRSRWTVSPEFGDALFAAMREQSQTGGPLPRFPSVLKLSSELKETPSSTTSPYIKLDSAERLKMKTRVAIRDRKHRFQVVPLRDAGHYSSSDQTPSRGLKTTVVTATRSPGVARSDPHSWKKLRTNENTVPTSAEGSIKANTPERVRKPSERSKNVTATEYPCFELPAQTLHNRHIVSESLAHDPLFPLDSQPLTEISRHNEPTHCSNLGSKNYLSRHTHHFKSPSLGNPCKEPNLHFDLEDTPSPQVTCRKRTNTLSADHRRRPGNILATNVDNDCRNLVKKNSAKRHAIYTQSLYVPVHERSYFPSDSGPKRSLEEPSPLRAFPFRSSIPTSRNKPDFTSPRSAHASSVLGFIDLPASSSGFLESTFDSQTSLCSIYSQDELSLPSHPALIHPALIQTRPLTRLGHPSDSAQVPRGSKMDETPIQHHPVVLMLLAEVEKARQDWCTI